MVGVSDLFFNGEVFEFLKGLKLEGGDDEVELINGLVFDMVRFYFFIVIYVCLLVN